MKTQISRLSRDLHAPYSGVYQQQGRMFTDADVNAQTEISKHRLDSVTDDTIGSGTPENGGIIQPDGGGGFALHYGIAYADGIRAVLQSASVKQAGEPFDFADQLDFPDAPPPPQAAFIAYLDVWERPIISLEADALIDAALHGADTTTRTKTMAQVKWGPAGFDPEDPNQNPPIGQARLTLTLRSGTSLADPCEPCLDEITVDTHIGNDLFRVEIHDVGYDAAGEPERVVLKWSRENGAEAAVIGREPPGFKGSDWIFEIYHGRDADAASECHLGYHHVDALGGWTPARGILFEGYPESPDPGFNLIRRFDGYAEFAKSGSSWQLTSQLIDGTPAAKGKDRNQRLATNLAVAAHGHVSEGAEIRIDLDMLTLELNLGHHPLLAGDYWMVAVRNEVHNQGDRLLDKERPHGIRHHYLCLAEIDGTDLTPINKDDCRRIGFPRLTDIKAGQVCFDNTICEMPGVGNVQQALNHLCQQRDLAFHNKHLHGWGIVCGLIAECCPNEMPDGGTDHDPDECLIITKGYALTCEGEDIVVDEPIHVDLMEQIQQTQPPILERGRGSVCLWIDHDGGQPVVRFERQDAEDDNFWLSLLDGTLLGDFLSDCIANLGTAIGLEFDFLNAADDQDNGSNGRLVGEDRRKLTAFVNLAIQYFNKENGAYVWLAANEHELLKDIYNGLRKALQSKTFCAMFNGGEFPDYPFQDLGVDTWFGNAAHSKIKAFPDGKLVYTYGGDAIIQVFDSGSGELVERITVNGDDGAEVTAIAIDAEERLLYVAAAIGDDDSVLSTYEIDSPHILLRSKIVLCDIIVGDLAVSPRDRGLIYATGLDRGMFFLRPDVLRDDVAAKLEPNYAFKATGQFAINVMSAEIIATAWSGDGLSDGRYNALAVMGMAQPDSNNQPPTLRSLQDQQGATRMGRDDMALKPSSPNEPYQIIVAVDPLIDNDQADKELLIFNITPNQLPDSIRASVRLPVENTDIALAYNSGKKQFFASFEDSYRLASIEAEKGEINHLRIPAQIQPVDVTAGADGIIYAYNFVSMTVTAIPRRVQDVSQARRDAINQELAQYRHAILLAFYELMGGLIQYLKDCFCHLLLVKCPECMGDEKIYLACVEIRDDKIYNICNFSKRKYVRSFPTVEYWLSILPVIPMIGKAVGELCCMVLPGLFDNNQDQWAPPPPPPEDGLRSDVPNVIDSKTTSQAVTAYKQFDSTMFWRDQRKNVGLFGTFGRDAVLASGNNDKTAKGIKRNSLIDAPPNDAKRSLEAAGVTVVGIKPYSRDLATRSLLDFTGTSSKFTSGSQVFIYEKDGKTMFIAEEKRPALVKPDPIIDLKIKELDEKRTKFKDEIDGLQGVIAELEEKRLAEEQKLEEVRQSRRELTDQLTAMNNDLDTVQKKQNDLRIDFERGRPVNDLGDIDRPMLLKLHAMGIRTIGELAATTGSKLRTGGVVTSTQAGNALRKKAQNRLK